MAILQNISHLLKNGRLAFWGAATGLVFSICLPGVAMASSIAVGVYPGYTFPGNIDTYTQLAGRKPDVVFWFQSWSEPLYYSSQMSGIDARGVTPQITWSPEGISLSDLNSGSYDSYITTQALAAKSYGKPMQIRLAHEFNGPWQSFCPCNSGQTNAQFITFWRHVVDIFRANGANNVQWVWSPNIYITGQSGGAVAFDAMYPGDSYVDWVALDGYNFGPPNNPWRSLLEVFKPSYDDLAQLTAKPIMIAEWGSTESAGDKAAWIRQGFLTDLPQQMPRILQVDEFDRVAESDFTINSSAPALSAYQDMIASPIYGAGAKAGDFNGDGAVNILDLSVLLSHWGGGATAANGDLSSDGLINTADLTLFLTRWGG